MFKKEIRMPILALVLLSLGGLLLHLRIHSPAKSLFNWVPAVSCVFAMLALPIMFNYRRTAPLAYIINIAIVIVGTVTMAWWSATNWKVEMALTLQNVLLYSTLADILILATKLPLGYIILRYHRDADAARRRLSQEL